VGKWLYASRLRAFRRDAHQSMNLETIGRLGSGTSPVTSIQLELVICRKSQFSNWHSESVYLR
jgi:hypothetical protein